MLTRHVSRRCSTLPTIALAFAQGGAGSPGVSQNINIIYHAPASLQVPFPPFSWGNRWAKGGVRWRTGVID